MARDPLFGGEFRDIDPDAFIDDLSGHLTQNLDSVIDSFAPNRTKAPVTPLKPPSSDDHDTS